MSQHLHGNWLVARPALKHLLSKQNKNNFKQRLQTILIVEKNYLIVYLSTGIVNTK